MTNKLQKDAEKEGGNKLSTGVEIRKNKNKNKINNLKTCLLMLVQVKRLDF